MKYAIVFLAGMLVIGSAHANKAYKNHPDKRAPAAATEFEYDQEVMATDPVTDWEMLMVTEEPAMIGAETDQTKSLERQLSKNSALSPSGQGVKVLEHEGLFMLHGKVSTANEANYIKQLLQRSAPEQTIVNQIQLSGDDIDTAPAF